MAREVTLPKAQLIVSLDDETMVAKVRQAVKLMKGVCGVEVKKTSLHDKILNSAAYKAAMDDVEQGRVYEAESVEEMFKKILA